MRRLLKVNEESPVFLWWQRGGTFVLVTVAWVIFRADSLRTGLSILKRIVTDITPWVFFDGTIYTCGIGQRSFLAWIVCVALVAVVELRQEKGNLRERLEGQHVLVRWGIYLGAIALVTVLGVYGPGYDAAQFIYGRF